MLLGVEIEAFCGVVVLALLSMKNRTLLRAARFFVGRVLQSDSDVEDLQVLLSESDALPGVVLSDDGPSLRAALTEADGAPLSGTPTTETDGELLLGAQVDGSWVETFVRTLTDDDNGCLGLIQCAKLVLKKTKAR